IYLIENKESFDEIWEYRYSLFTKFNKTREEALHIYNTLKEKIDQLKKKEEERKSVLAARMVKLVNFSRIFFKGCLNIFYILLCIAAIFVTYNYVAPFLIWVVSYLFNGVMSLSETFWLILGIVFLGTIALTLVSYYFVVEVDYKEVSEKISTRIVKPSKIDIIANKMVNFIVRCIENFVTFISTFYESNCPPIELEE